MMGRRWGLVLVQGVWLGDEGVNALRGKVESGGGRGNKANLPTLGAGGDVFLGEVGAGGIGETGAKKVNCGGL